MNFIRAIARILRRIFWLSPAKRWDWRAAELREDFLTEAEILAVLGPRPDDEPA